MNCCDKSNELKPGIYFPGLDFLLAHRALAAGISYLIGSIAVVGAFVSRREVQVIEHDGKRGLVYLLRYKVHTKPPIFLSSPRIYSLLFFTPLPLYLLFHLVLLGCDFRSL